MARWGRVPEQVTALGARPTQLFAALAAHNGPAGCFPKHATLARLMGCSVSSVERAARVLVRAGAIQVEQRRGRGGYRIANGYRLRNAWSELPVTQTPRSELPVTSDGAEHALSPTEIEQRPCGASSIREKQDKAVLAAVRAVERVNAEPVRGAQRGFLVAAARRSVAIPPALASQAEGILGDMATEPGPLARRWIEEGARRIRFGEYPQAHEREVMDLWPGFVPADVRDRVSEVPTSDGSAWIEKMRADLEARKAATG